MGTRIQQLSTVLVVGLVGLGLAACGGAAAKSAAPLPGQPTEAAGAATVRYFTALAKGQYGREWDELHPAQQAVVSRDKFTDCGGKASIDIPASTSFAVTETYDDPLSMTSIPEHAAKAVTIAITIPGGHTGTVTKHEVAVDGHWRWILGDTDVAAYAAGHCP